MRGQPRIGQKVDHHGRDALPDGDAVARDQARRELAVPARQDHDRRADVERAVHAAGHAGDMEEGQGGEVDRVLRAAEPADAADQGTHHAGMGVHAAL